MASKIADVEIQLRAQVATLQRDLDKAQGQLDRFASRTKAGFDRLSSSLRLALPTAAIATGLAAATRAAVDFSDEVDATSKRLGIGAEALQEFRFAAGEADVDVSALERAIATLNRRAGEAVGGNKEAIKAFDVLGVSVRDANGAVKSTDVLFREVGRAMDALGSQAEKAAASQKFFGDRTGALTPLFAEQGRVLEESIAKAREYGLVVDEALIKKGAEASRTLEVLGGTFRTKLNIEILDAISALQAMADQFDELENRGTRSLEFTRGRALALGNELRDVLILMRKQGEEFHTTDLPGGLRGKSALGVTRQELEELIRQQDAEVARIDALLERRAAGINAQGGAGGFIGPVAQTTTTTPNADGPKAARALAREQAEGERLMQRLREQRLQAEGRTIELLQERFRVEAEVVQQSALSDEQKKAALEDLGRTLDAQVRAAVDAGDKLPDVAEEATDAFEGFGDFIEGGLTDALADLAITGEISFESLGNAFLREFIQRAIEGVFELEAAMTAIEGIGAFIGSFSFGGAASAVPAAKGGIFTKPTLVHLAEGGEAEGVFPLSKLDQFTGGLTVNVINNASDQVGVEVRQNRSTKRTEIVIDRRIAQGVRSAQGEEALQTYGVQRQGRRRA